MRLDEKWIRSHLPPEVRNEPIDCFACEYLDGLTVMQEGERGGDDIIVFHAKNEDELRLWQLKQICRFIKEKNPSERKTWRYYRKYAKDGKWYYSEHKSYDYNAIEDPRLYGFECFLRNLKYGFPPEMWEEEVIDHIHLMNYWYSEPHWDYDREKMCFIEISDSKEHDAKGCIDEPREGSVIEVLD